MAFPVRTMMAISALDPTAAHVISRAFAGPDFGYLGND